MTGHLRKRPYFWGCARESAGRVDRVETPAPAQSALLLNRAPSRRGVHAAGRGQCRSAVCHKEKGPRLNGSPCAVIKLAERQGFEPWVRLPVQRLSRPPPSTTRPPLRGRRILADGPGAFPMARPGYTDPSARKTSHITPRSSVPRIRMHLSSRRPGELPALAFALAPILSQRRLRHALCPGVTHGASTRHAVWKCRPGGPVPATGAKFARPFHMAYPSARCPLAVPVARRARPSRF